MPDIAEAEQKNLTPEELKGKKVRGARVVRHYSYDTHEKGEDGAPVLRLDAMSEEDWRAQVLKEWVEFAEKNCEKAAMIFHDRDINTDGGPAGLHVHGVFKFKNRRYLTALQKSLGASALNNVLPVATYKGAFRYLTHVTDDALNDRKYVYPANDVHCINMDYRDEIRGNAESKQKKLDMAAVQDFIGSLHYKILEEGLTDDEAKEALLNEFDRSNAVMNAYTKIRGEFKNDMNKYDELRAKRILKDGRELKTGYISGKGGTGKTKLARALAQLNADGRGIHAVAQQSATKTFDMVSLYNGELSSVFDEVMPSGFEAREFLGIFDPHNYTPINSRNTDKHWLAEHAYFTNSLAWEEWRKNLIRYSKGGAEYVDVETDRFNKDAATEDLVWQVTRRFHFIAELTTQYDGRVKANVYVLNNGNRGYMYAGATYAPAGFWMNEDQYDLEAEDGRQIGSLEQFAMGVQDLVNATHNVNGEDKVVYDHALKQDLKKVDADHTTDEAAILFKRKAEAQRYREEMDKAREGWKDNTSHDELINPFKVK